MKQFFLKKAAEYETFVMVNCINQSWNLGMHCLLKVQKNYLMATKYFESSFIKSSRNYWKEKGSNNLLAWESSMWSIFTDELAWLLRTFAPENINSLEKGVRVFIAEQRATCITNSKYQGGISAWNHVSWRLSCFIPGFTSWIFWGMQGRCLA